jgi:cytoskeleton protein RodZ
MTEPSIAAATSVPAATSRSAGGLLRAAREREGLHLAVLAATIKVTPAKLEALEQDRYDQLPNLTFARALAQSVCRSLKIDPRPVLALLPQVETAPLEGAMGTLNTPFNERSSRSGGAGLTWASKPMFWAGGLLLLAAVVIGLLPPELVEGWTAAMQPAAPASASALAAPAPAPAASVSEAVVAPMPGPSAAASVAVAAPIVAEAAPTVASPAAAPAAPESLLRLTTTADSWIEVIDAQGRTVLSRVVQGGETVAIDPAPPLRLRIGNAGGTTLAFRGQPVDLGPHTRDNVARLELR